MLMLRRDFFTEWHCSFEMKINIAMIFLVFSSSTTRLDESGDLGHVVPVAAGEQSRVI